MAVAPFRWCRLRPLVSGAKDAACTRSLCSIRSGSTNGINFPCPLESGPSSRFWGQPATGTYNNKTSTQRQFKTGVPQGGVLSPTLFNIYTSDIPSPPPNINITVYVDDIMTSTDTNKQIAQAKLQPYLQEIASWTQQNQLHLNPDKTTSTLFTPDPAEYSTQLTLNIDNVVIPTVKKS